MRVSFYKQRHAIWQKKIIISFLLPIFILLTSVITLLVLPATPATAATSDSLNFQGRLLTNTGGLVPDGSYNIEFKIYDDPSAGTNWWTENLTGGSAITVKNGYFSVYLGEVTPFSASVPWDQDLYMTMNVNGDGEMTPRFKLTAVPYAFRAGAVTDSAGNAFTGDDLIQKSPSSIQAANSALAVLRFNQAGAGGLVQLQSGGTDAFTVDNSGNTAVAGAVTSGTGSSGGSLVLTDGSGSNLTLQSGVLGGDLTFTFPTGDGSNGQCLKTNGSGSLSFGDCGSGGGGGGAAVGTTIVKSATQTINNDNTLNNDPDLLFPIAANETWAFRFVLQANSATQPDFQFAITAPSGATCIVGVIDPETAASVANLGCGVSSGLITGNGTDDVYEIAGTVVNGANAGSVTLQWAQNASNANNTTVYAGSYLFATADGSSASGGTAFEQNGNAFGATAVIGTTDNNGLDIITNGGTRLGFTASGNATFSSSLTVSSGGLTITGGVDNNFGGLSEAGTITGVTSITGTAGLTIASGGSGDLTLDSASGLLLLADDTIRRSGTGSTTIDLLDASGNTTLNILNSDGTRVANLSVEGSITGTSIVGDGSSISGLNAGNISSGTLDDLRLSSNVALLDQNQTFTGLPTFDSGLILGTSSSTTAGAVRWSGADFEGYDGVQWVSLTSGGGGGLGGGSSTPAQTTVTKPIDEIVNNSATLQDDNNLKFSIGANETWAFRFVLQGNSGVTPDFKFAVTAPSGATCAVSFSDPEGATSQANLGCGVATASVPGNGTDDLYEITGTVANGATAGDVTLQWAQFTANASNTIVRKGSYLLATIEGGGQLFLQGGNDFGSTAVLGTTGSNDLNFITNGSTALSLTTSNQAIFSGAILANDGITIGNSAGDGFTIVSDSVALTNGLNFDADTFVIDSVNNRVGIGTAITNNRLNINNATTTDATAQALVGTGATGNKGLVIQGVASQTANLFEVQSSTGSTLAGFNSSGGLVLGLSTLSSTATVARNISLPDASGTICLSGSTLCGYIQFASGSFQTDASTSNSIAINKTGASGNLLALQKNGGAVFTVSNTGALQIQSTGTAALDIRNVGGTSYFSVDTSTGIVRVGPTTADAVGVLFVLDTKNNAGDPTGTNGGIYYNSSLGKFRCFENSVWLDCIGTKQIRSYVDTVVDAVATTNLVNYWDLAAENNNSYPKITPSSSTKSVFGSVSVQVSSTTTQDRSVVTRVERGIGAVPTCGSGTVVGFYASTFTTNSGEIVTATITFLDSPATTSQVFYTVCSDSNTTSAAGVQIDKIRLTLEEANNSN